MKALSGAAGICLILFWLHSMVLGDSRDPFDYAQNQTAPAIPKPRTSASHPTHSDGSLLYLRLQHLSPETALKNFRAMFPGVHWMADPQEQYLIAQGQPETLKQIQKVLKVLDQPLAQIEIEAQIIEISQSALENLGVQWQSLEKGLAMVQVQDLVQKINFLIASGQAQIKARPRLSTLTHKTALIRIGDRIPYSVPIISNSGVLKYGVEYLDAGILLKILPTLAQNDLITVSVHTRISSLKEWKATAAGEYPIIATRESDTQLHVRSGETLMLAGLLNEEERQFFEKMPLLGDLPLLGGIFRNQKLEKQKTDILFLITPRKVTITANALAN